MSSKTNLTGKTQVMPTPEEGIVILCPIDAGAINFRERSLSVDSPSNAECAITVWKDGSWQRWGAMDAYLAQSDPDFLANISLKEIISEDFNQEKGEGSDD